MWSSQNVLALDSSNPESGPLLTKQIFGGTPTALVMALIWLDAKVNGSVLKLLLSRFSTFISSLSSYSIVGRKDWQKEGTESVDSMKLIRISHCLYYWFLSPSPYWRARRRGLSTWATPAPFLPSAPIPLFDIDPTRRWAHMPQEDTQKPERVARTRASTRQ